MGLYNRLVVMTGEGDRRGSRTGDHMNQPALTAVTTDGAITLTAAMIAGGLITSASKTASRTATTDTGANLDLAWPNMNVGDVWMCQIASIDANTLVVAGGTGVTASGNLTIPANAAKEFYFTKTGVGTYNVVGL